MSQCWSVATVPLVVNSLIYIEYTMFKLFVGIAFKLTMRNRKSWTACEQTDASLPPYPPSPTSIPSSTAEEWRGNRPEASI